jgi:hypothetical protein
MRARGSEIRIEIMFKKNSTISSRDVTPAKNRNNSIIVELHQGALPENSRYDKANQGCWASWEKALKDSYISTDASILSQHNRSR